MAKTKILVCDDDEGILDLLRLILKSSGFDTITEKNSLQVTSVVEAQQPDLVLLDLWMPALNGDQVLRNLKADPKTASLPVIMISASPEGKQVAMEAGASEFIAKPFQIAELVRTIHQVLNN